MKPSKYQQDFYDAVLTSNSNIVLSATAGSGKTFSLVEATKYLPYGKSVLFAAFNKHIVNELKNRLPQHVECRTLHALGLRAIFNHYPPGSVKVSENKQIRFIEPLFEKERNRKVKWSNIYETDQILRLARATMTELNEEALGKMLENHAIFPEQDIMNATIIAGNNLYAYNSDIERYGMDVDFQDMISLCVSDKDITMPQFDCVLLDEIQDMSMQDQAFIQRLIKPLRGRFIGVGDKNQSIYNFRGSATDSFDYFVNRPNTIKLPLTISYRCGKKIVEHAKKVYPEIEQWDQNIDGEVKENGDLSEVSNGDMVIARNLRPLVDAFFQLLELGKKCTIVGKELEKGLLQIIGNINGETSTQELIENILPNKLASKKQELIRLGYSNPTVHPKYVAYEEKVKVISKIASKCVNLDEVENAIESIFSDQSIAPIKLLTIHKAKGTEADNVFLIEKYEGKDLIPNQYAVTKEQLVQEKNLRFVSYTRSKKKLIKINL